MELEEVERILFSSFIEEFSYFILPTSCFKLPTFFLLNNTHHNLSAPAIIPELTQVDSLPSSKV